MSAFSFFSSSATESAVFAALCEAHFLCTAQGLSCCRHWSSFFFFLFLLDRSDSLTVFLFFFAFASTDGGPSLFFFEIDRGLQKPALPVSRIFLFFNGGIAFFPLRSAIFAGFFPAGFEGMFFYLFGLFREGRSSSFTLFFRRSDRVFFREISRRATLSCSFFSPVCSFFLVIEETGFSQRRRA